MRSALIVALAALLAAAPSGGVLIDSGDGSGNTGAPPDDPGWAYVGTTDRNLTGIYIGNGYVLTANHVGEGDFLLSGVVYPHVPGSKIGFQNPNGQAYPDLVVFRLDPAGGLPPLPPLPILYREPLIGEGLVLVGNGVRRGAATEWMGIGGWRWGSGQVLRWGTNAIRDTGVWATVGNSYSRAFTADFTPVTLGTPHEAQSVTGDSGGAAFVKEGAAWMLAGVQYAISLFPGQPAYTSLYGNLSIAVDASFYRDQILAAIGCAGADDDGDGIGNACDNCTRVANANQFDADGDLYGNACDADYDQNGLCGSSDLNRVREAFGAVQGDAGYDPVLDVDADGSIGSSEFNFARACLGHPPGPSGLAP